MANAIHFTMTSPQAIKAAFQEVPKRAVGAIRRIFTASGKRMAKAQRAAAFEGGSGINLPARKTRQTKKGLKVLKSRTGNKTKVQAAHLKTKTTRRGAPVLINYSSVFAGFHEKKIRRQIEGIFATAVPGINQAVEKDLARIGQAALDKHLSDRGLR